MGRFYASMKPEAPVMTRSSQAQSADWAWAVGSGQLTSIFRDISEGSVDNAAAGAAPVAAALPATNYPE